MTGLEMLPKTGTPVAGRSGVRHMPGHPDLSKLLDQFPPRPQPAGWDATEASRGLVLARLLEPPFAFDHDEYQAHARRGLQHVLDWLQSLPGRTWQDRWIASGAEHLADWRPVPAGQAAAAGRSTARRETVENQCSVGLSLLICADVIRPRLEWLLVTPAPKNLAAAMARTRDPATFAQLEATCQASNTGKTTRLVALARIAAIMATKGGQVGDTANGAV